MYQVIQLHTAAPPKPAEGAPCNGCGVCCASEPCPIGALVSRRLHGACDALEWAEETGVYRCGLIEHPAAHLPAALHWSASLVGRAAHRFISAGSGCDCSVSVGEDLR